MDAHFEDELASDYGVLDEKKGFLEELDAVAAEIDADWGTAVIDRDEPGNYEVGLTYLASSHDDVLHIFQHLLDDDRVDYESDLMDDRYVRYDMTIDLDI